MKPNQLLTITVYTDPDGLWGQESTDGYDVDASVAQYNQLLTHDIQSKYPNARVFHFYESTNRSFEIDEEYELTWEEVESIERALEQMVHEVYIDFCWLIPVKSVE